MEFATKAIHAGQEPDPATGCTVTPLYLTSVFTFDELGKTYVTSTTHHEKLWPRIEGGGGGGCPVLTFAITRKVYVDDGQGDG